MVQGHQQVLKVEWTHLKDTYEPSTDDTPPHKRVVCMFPPGMAQKNSAKRMDELKEVVNLVGVLTGVDYSVSAQASSDEQHLSFLEHCALAQALNKTVSIVLLPELRYEECQRAEEDLLSWLHEANLPEGFPIHVSNYGGSPTTARKVI